MLSTSYITLCAGSPVGGIIGGVVGALVAVILIIVVILLVVCLVKKKRSSSKYEVSKTSRMEMGTRTPAKPILGGKC